MTDPPATRLPDVGQGRRAGSLNLTFYEVIKINDNMAVAPVRSMAKQKIGL